MIPILKKNEPWPDPNTLEGAIVLIDKQEDWTSFDVVNRIRRALKIKKVGHAGTLDPFATGLLIVGLGKGTRELGRFMEMAKRYRTIIHLGVETDTFDRTGKVIRKNSLRSLKFKEIEKTLESMQGEMWQTPPMYAAIKHKGVPLYKLARKGKEVEREPRKITIYQVKALGYQEPFVEVEMEVSKGTYIRSYGHELGQRLGTGACLQELRRTGIGPFSVDDAYTIDEFIDQWQTMADN